MSKEINKRIAGIFGDEIVQALRLFVDKINQQNPDIVILIARKAIRLFDLLSYLGIERPKGEIISDRALELQAEYYANKKVIIVDDTLILGTTLRKISEELKRSSVDFQIFVFCVDQDNWCKDLIIPDYICKFFAPEQVLEFCSREVEAFSAASLPYIVDFPVSVFTDISSDEYSTLINRKDIQYIRLAKDTVAGIEKNVLLENDAIRDLFFGMVGKNCKDMFITLKVRFYVSNTNESMLKIKIVPMALLGSIHDSTIHEIFSFILQHLDNVEDATIIRNLVKIPEIRLRFIQYYFSYLLGKAVINHLFQNTDVLFEFSRSDLINLFGQKIGMIYHSLLISGKIVPYPYVVATQDQARICIGKEKDIFEGIFVDGNHLIGTFQQIFVNLFEKRELPAREEIKMGNNATHLKNRLLNGVCYESLVTYICDQLGVVPNRSITSILGIGLDLCNDLGIFVPILCSMDGYYYRAYRHGELGKRTENNNYLFYKFLEAFCESNQYDITKGIDRLLLEKLAVLFYRIGAKNKLIDVTYLYDDPQAVNFGYYLMGAVLIDNNNNKGIKDRFFPDAQDWFLSNHCYGLFRKTASNKYSLNRIPIKAGVSIKENAEYMSKQIGRAFGNLVKLNASEIPDDVKGYPLDENRLVILASCYSLGDITMALAAELSITQKWIIRINEIRKRYGSYRIDDIPFGEDFKTSNVYTAFNQAYLKYSYSFSSNRSVKNIISDCEKYLAHHSIGKDSLDAWVNYAKKMNIGQETIFDPADESNTKRLAIVHKIASLIFFTGMELIYIRFLVEVFYNLTRPRIGYGSIIEYTDSIGGKYASTFVKEVIANLKQNEIGYRTKQGIAFKGKQKGDPVSYKLKSVEYEYTISKVINTNITFDAEVELDEFYDRLNRMYIEYKMLTNVKESYFPNLDRKYESLRNRMNGYRNCTERKLLNTELNRILDMHSNRIDKMDELITLAVENYSESRENLVALLK